MQVSQNIIQEIADILEKDIICYIDVKTHEIVKLHDASRYLDLDTEDPWDDIYMTIHNLEKYKEIARLTTKDTIKAIHDFIELIDDESLKTQLSKTIQGHKPYANFKHQIENSGPYEEMWLKFKKSRLIEWVAYQVNATIS